MATKKLTAFSYAVLTLVGEGGAGPHDLVQMMRRGRVYWTAPASQFYAEPKRLEQAGLLRSRKEPGRTRERTVYELTDAGREALRRWVATPASFPRIQNEPVVRALAADLVDDDGLVLAGLQPLRAEIDELLAGVAEGERAATALPHRRERLLINHRLARRVLEAHRDWLDELERELGGPAG